MTTSSTHCCDHGAKGAICSQSLDEMEFERGLWSAALNGELERVERMLAEAKDPNVIDSSGYTPLHYAARSGHLDVCRALISHSASVNAQTRSGHVTPLHRAAYCGHTDVVRLLIRHGADVTLCDEDGRNALHKACERDKKEVVKLLLKTNPGLKNVRDKREKLPLDYCSIGEIKALLTDIT